MVEYWKTKRTGDLQKAVEIAQGLAVDLAGKGLHQVRIELLNDALRNQERPAKTIALLVDIAGGYRMQGMLTEALTTLKIAIASFRNQRPNFRGTALNNIGHIYHERCDYDNALKYLCESLNISHASGDRLRESITLNNISQIYDARKDYDTALKYLEESLEISREIGDRRNESAELNNISQIYRKRGNMTLS